VSFTFALCRQQPPYAKCHYAECGGVLHKNMICDLKNSFNEFVPKFEMSNIT